MVLQWYFLLEGGLTKVSKRVKFLKIQGCATTFGDWAPVVVIVWWACGMIRVPKFIILDSDGLCLWCVSGVGVCLRFFVKVSPEV